MYLRKLVIANFKTFHLDETLEFDTGFNILLGPNNSGKTSILEVLGINKRLNQPHRSVQSVRAFGGTAPGSSKFEVSMNTSLAELAESEYGPLPIPLNNFYSSEDVPHLLKQSLKNDTKITLKFAFGNDFTGFDFSSDQDIIKGRSSSSAEQNLRCAFIQTKGLIEPIVALSGANLVGHADRYVLEIKRHIYAFSAARRPAARSPLVDTAILDPEAQRLAFCINHLQTNDAHGHKLLCDWMERIFPSVRWVQSTPVEGVLELRCLPEPPEHRRHDLAVPLSHMGTGIGNVLAILYVVLTARTPQLIAIDEPNAFLHPRALRDLLAILESEGKQHQFLLSAHSADVLTAINPKTISILDFNGVTTTVKAARLKDIHLMRAGLADLGIRITDLHAKDRVLWVEGQTEELVFPELLRWACPEVAAGTAILRVERTGTFSTKQIDPGEVASLYERLSVSSALVPPMVTILLDKEKLSIKDERRLLNLSNGKIRLLPRRMLENYILNAEAIHFALIEGGVKVEAGEINSRLTETGIDDASICDADGAKILARLFADVSDSKMEFRKTRDVPAMVNYLIENSPKHLLPLKVFLREVFDLSDQNTQNS